MFQKSILMIFLRELFNKINQKTEVIRNPLSQNKKKELEIQFF